MPIPEETCRFYHWIESRGSLTEGDPVALALTNCDEFDLLGEPLYFFSMSQEERNSANYADGSGLGIRLHEFSQHGPAAIHVRVLYPDGGFTDYQHNVEIEDVAPTITRIESQAGPVDPGAVSTLTGFFLDPGVHDVHQVSVDWGDGSALSSLELSAGSREFTASHVYAQSGVFTATVTVTDLETDKSGSATTEFFVSGVALQESKLRIIGTDEDDRIDLRVGNHGIEVLAYLGEMPRDRSRFSAAEVEGIEFLAFSGDDRLRSRGSGIVAMTVQGGMGDDDIATGRGDDRIADLHGDNVIRSGSGNDRVFSGLGDDRIDTGPGDNWIEDSGGDNRIQTGSGDDTVLSGDGDDRIHTGSGDDRVEDSGGDNRIQTGSGDDTVLSGDGDDRIHTGSGDDRVEDSGGDNRIQTGSGDDTVLRAGPVGPCRE